MSRRELFALFAGVALSWPLVLAFFLLGLVKREAWRAPDILFPAIIGTIAIAGICSYWGSSTLQRHLGVWFAAAGLGSAVLCGYLVFLSELSDGKKIFEALTASFLIQPFAAPFLIPSVFLLAAAMGWSVKFVNRCGVGPHRARLWSVLAIHWVAGALLLLVLRATGQIEVTAGLGSDSSFKIGFLESLDSISCIPPLARSFQAPEQMKGREAEEDDGKPGSEPEQGGIASAGGGR